MGKFIEDNYIAEFVVEDDIRAVWNRLQEQGAEEARWLSAFPRFPGFDATAELIETIEPKLVRARKVAEPCRGTEIAISLESVETGTRVLVVQSGFPAYVKDALESFRIGGDQIIADLALFLSRGVCLSRHRRAWGTAGVMVRDVETGIEVVAASPGAWGERVGLAGGDLLVALNGAPIFNQYEFSAMQRLLGQGASLEAQWVRGSEVMTSTAEL